jgi:hypothetical protein
MKINSPLFDRIRVKPEKDRSRRPDTPKCEWQGCEGAATHRAPKGRDREKEYWRFCLEHVRVYNNSYNFFAGMSDDAVNQYQKDALTGHRPTWKMGANGGKGRKDGSPGTRRGADRFDSFEDAAADPFDVLREFGGAGRRQARFEQAKRAEARTVHNAERKALDTLGLEAGATVIEIKTRFKMLVKRHHPDVNGGDRSSEDTLRDVIQAYQFLKTLQRR